MIADIMDHDTAGDPMTLRRWSRKSLHRVSAEIRAQNISISANTASRLLKELHYSLKSNRKEIAETQHPDRDLQFKIISQTRIWFEQTGCPIISVDTKKKERVGNFKNSGKTWCQEPEEVYTHDFRSQALGTVNPYGIYEPVVNKGAVVVGTAYDTPQFAVESIELWLTHVGFNRYSSLNNLLILCDAGGSNSCRFRAWKYYLYHCICQKYGITVTIRHYPTGASKWNPIEHRMFSFISSNWAGVPLRSHDIILNYIRGTTTKTGLQIEAILNEKQYEKGIKISDQQMKEINIRNHEILPQWNYEIMPKTH